MPWIMAFGPWIIGVAVALGGVLWKLERRRLTAFYDAHTTAQQRAALAADAALVRTLAPEAVALVEHDCPQLSGAEKFAQGVAHVVSVLHHKGLAGDVEEIRGAVQKAYADMATNGTLAVNTPPTPGTTEPSVPAAVTPAS